MAKFRLLLVCRDIVELHGLVPESVVSSFQEVLRQDKTYNVLAETRRQESGRHRRRDGFDSNSTLYT